MNNELVIVLKCGIRVNTVWAIGAWAPKEKPEKTEVV